jgi:effector-binding domain-containing protein
MKITTRVIDAVAQPMIYVTSRSSMHPDEVRQTMERSFALLGRFMQEEAVLPLAPPLAVYRDWNGQLVTVEVGFPVSAADAAKAKGEIKAGHTPAGPAIKTVHKGPYVGLKDTYALLDEAMKSKGFRPGEVSWEIYFGEPGKTPDEDLITEIYMQLLQPDLAWVD